MIKAIGKAACRVAIFFILFTVPVVAAAQDREQCLERDASRSLDACSRIIANDQLVGKDLATIYVVRATIYRMTKDYGRAIADMTHAIELLKGTASRDIVASAYATRASIYLLNENSDKALADYHQVLTFDPNNSLASSAITQIETASAPNSPGTSIEPPTEPIPNDIQTDPAVLQLVQTDPFFANPPAARIGTYSVVSSFHSVLNPGGQANSNSSNQVTRIHWLRAGITSEESTTESTNSNTSGTLQSETENMSLEASDGLFSLGNHAVTRSRFGKTSTVSHIIRMDGLSGSIFLMHQGDQFSYNLTSEVSTQSPGLHYNDTMIMKYACEYGRTYDAQRFYPGLNGLAHLLNCTYATVYKKNSAANSTNQETTLFFDDLGYWLSVDPTSPQERLVENGLTTKMGKYVSTIIGKSALDSLSLAR